MSLHLITAKAGTAHISAADDARLNKALYGDRDFAFDSGENFAASITTNNNVRIYDGLGMIQGRRWQIESGTYEDVTIENGESGLNRNDLICFMYSKDTSTGIETGSITVIKGTAASTATDPTYTAGDIDDGDTTAYMPLYRVKIEGLTLSSIESLISIDNGTQYGTAEPDSTIESPYYDQLLD